MLTTHPDPLDHNRFLAQDYAIFDPKRIPRDIWVGLNPVPLVPAGLANDPATLPQLVHLRPLSEDRRIDLLVRSDEWMRDNERPLFSALLCSDSSPDQLAGHLAPHLLLSVPAGGKAWLCFYNPSVFQHLCWQWTDAQLAALLGPVRSWIFFASGFWHTYQPSVSPVLRQLRLTNAQWEQLERVEALNGSLMQLRRMAPDKAMGRAVAPQLDTALFDADQHERLQEQRDRMLFAVQRLAYGSQLHRNPAIRKKVEDARNGLKTYMRSCVGLRDADYRRLAAEVVECEGAHQ